MIYGRWAYVPQGLSHTINFTKKLENGESLITYVRKHPELEFDGRCFWNGTNKQQEVHYWRATEGEDWELVEKVVDAGDYWVVCDYQIIEEKTKEAKAKKIDITTSPLGTWTVTSAVPWNNTYLTVSSNGWENAYASTGTSMRDYIEANVRDYVSELIQEQFDAFLNYIGTPTENEIQRAVMEALHKEDWREALDQLVPHYISSWEIFMPPYGVKELRCDGVDGRNHVFNLDMLGIE